jgi:integrase
MTAPLLFELVRCYQDWATGYYLKDGKPTATIKNIRDATRELLATFPEMTVDQFGAPHLRQVQAAMISSGRLSRRTINDRINWIRACFTWAAEMGLADELLPHRLKLVRHLRPGRSAAKDSDGVHPVRWDQVAATLAHANPNLRAMILVQWHTGMRPGELVIMHRADIDMTSADCWLYSPRRHKTQHFGKPRVIALGPVARAVLAPVLLKSTNWLWPSSIPDRPMARLSYYRAIQRINEKHHLAAWFPNQIRHSAATRLRREAGIETARVVLGHANIRTTEIYAEADMTRAVEAMARLG